MELVDAGIRTQDNGRCDASQSSGPDGQIINFDGRSLQLAECHRGKCLLDQKWGANPQRNAF